MHIRLVHVRIVLQMSAPTALSYHTAYLLLQCANRTYSSREFVAVLNRHFSVIAD